MTELPEIPERLQRLRSRPAAKTGDWYRIENSAEERSATLHIYDEIGWAGTSAKDLAGAVRALDVDSITVRLNSPGGDAWDGVAIYNSLKDHAATVTVIVDALAASAASYIAQAGDKIVMNRGSQMMIHDAAGMAIGNSRDMQDMAEILDRVSASIASIYADRSGRPVEEWREAMAKETWYSPQEAVDAGLADEVAVDPKVTAVVAAQRIHAAATKIKEKEAGRMDPVKIREALGLAEDASDDEVYAALKPVASAPAPQATAAGTMVIDQAAWDAQMDTIKRLEAADARRRRDERDSVISQAVADGKFPPFRRDHWVRLWDADPEGTRTVLDGLARNVMSVQALGYSLDAADDDFEREFAGLFPKES